MRTRLSSFCAALAIAGVAIASHAAADANDGRELDDGHVEISAVPVAGSDVPMIVVRAVVKSPPASVWKVVSDCAHYAERLPHTASSRLVSRSGNKVTCEVTLSVPFPMPNLTAVTLATHEEAPDHMTRSWKLVRGDYAFNEGSWDVRAHDGGKSSLVVYKVHAKPNTAVPGFIKDMAQKKALPQLIERLRAEAAKIK